MKIYIILNTITTLLFSPHQPTTMQFSSPIEYYSIGNSQSFQSYLTKNKKILLIYPEKKSFDDFLVVITKNQSYQFRLKNSSQKITALYHIIDGQKDKLYQVKNTTTTHKVLKGKRSIKISRTKGDYLIINDQKITSPVFYYPKNAYLSINGKEVQ